MVYEKGGDARIDKALHLSKKFGAEQLLIKVVFENGSDYYHHLHDQIYDEKTGEAVWGDSFLLLALRVVYILEKRRLQDCVKHDKDYPGFEMFNIFEDKYYAQLE